MKEYIKNMDEKWGIVIFLGIVFPVILFYNSYKKKKIINNPEFEVAKIIGFEGKGPHTHKNFVYAFKYNAVVFESYVVTDKYNKRFFQELFPVIFQQGKPENNRILIYAKDFEELGLLYPDSMSWTAEYEK